MRPNLLKPGKWSRKGPETCTKICYEQLLVRRRINDIDNERIRQENRFILLHKGLNGYANIPISDINQSKRKQRKGHNHQFQIPHTRTDIFQESFIPTTLKDWNQLDPNILQKSTSTKDPTSTFAEIIISHRFE